MTKIDDAAQEKSRTSTKPATPRLRVRTSIRAGVVSPRDAASGLPTGKRL